MFADYAKIYIKAGDGGDGHISFRREKYVPDGGPDGGDGGKGGDIIFMVDKGMSTLVDFKHKRKYIAENGQEGGKRRCHGSDGADLIIKVPEGTVIREAESGKVVMDMSGEHVREVVIPGGRGGIGNMHYATATMQAPKYAKPGKPGRGLDVVLELKSIADVGLIGYPNVGKSSLLSRTTNARPKIANYQFTTLAPNLGVVDLGGGEGFVMADIPGLIEGASEGVGLGHQFLRHIERTRLLVHLIDIAATDGRNPADDFVSIMKELSAYNAELEKLPQIIAANKCDLLLPEEREKAINELKKVCGDIKIYPISAATGEGVRELLYAVNNMRKTLPEKPVFYETDFEFGDEIEDLPYEITVEGDTFIVEGPLIEKMLGYTNLESERGFAFFQKFIKERGIQDELNKRGIKEGDTVRMYGHAFEYYD